MPWWGAVVIAFGFALFGIALDSAAARLLGLPGGIHAHQVCFVLGCLLAALAVRNRALFTAAVQPPLIAVGLLIARVIGVEIKGLVTGGNVPAMSSLLIKQVFAFSNDFPVILFTFLAVFSVVLVRWWRYRTARQAAAPTGADKADPATKAIPATRAVRRPAAAGSPAGPKAESAASRASRAAAAAQAAPVQARPATPGVRAEPAIVPSGRRSTGGPAVRPRADRMTAGAAAHGVRLDRAQQPAPPVARSAPPSTRPAPPSGRPSAPVSPPQPGRRRATPPPLDDEGF